MSEKEITKTIHEMSDLERGGVIAKILWATSIVRLAEEVKYNRHMLESHFDMQIKMHPEDTELAGKKDRCLKQFDEANTDTTSNVVKAREFFLKYPEFLGLIIPDKKQSLKHYWDSFDCQVQCEEVYYENGMKCMPHPSDDECEPFN